MFEQINNMKRIYIVIEFNEYDAIPQGAFESEEAAYEAMNEWMNRSGSSANWTVQGCTLHNM